jgi:restriction system protein
MEGIVILIFGGLVYYWINGAYKYLKKVELEQQKAAELLAYKENLELIKQKIKPHAKILSRKQEQLIYKDDYGKYVFDQWNKEVDYFIKKVLLSDSNIKEFIRNYDYDERLDAVRQLVDDVAFGTNTSNEEERSHELLPIDDMTGEDYERYCVDLLVSFGWNARLTKSNGDQGVDIIGTIDSLTVIFQCKRYSKPVGNSAVQEAISGMVFEKASGAAVITNNTFTVSARQLASAANIYLLHHTELESFTELLSNVETIT